MLKNYIFDLDGTIINSSNEVLDCFKKSFINAGVEIDESKFTSDIIGPPLRQIMQTLVPNLSDENLIQKVMQNFRAIYDNDENDISELYVGVKELLSKIKSCGNNMFIATFKPKKPTDRIIKQFKLNMFNEIYTIDMFGKNITKTEMINSIIEKYNFKKDETVMIGDAASDVVAAKETGIFSIGVLWGYGNDKSDLINQSDMVVKDIKELEECLKLN